MRKFILTLSFVWLYSFILSAQTPIVFNGNDLSSYVNQEVVFNQTLHVCGHYYHNLYLSYERLRQPEETAIIGTPEYINDSIQCANGIITVYLPNVLTDTVRLGSTVSNLIGTVTDARRVTVYGRPPFNNNNRPTVSPNIGDARLVICAANLQYYCPEWEGTYGAESNEEFATQHLKLMKALGNINADIYAVAEIQDGLTALQSITNGLNAQTAPNRYAYINDNNTQTTTYTKVGFIYRTDKVSPVLELGLPNTTYSFKKRQYVQAFIENTTQERFILSMNHFKAKDGTGSASTNAARMANAECLVDFLDEKLSSNYYQDSDILILGDLNCSTMEEPIRYLIENGYENQLQVHAPNEYSYVYDDCVLYLDHVLTSPSMSSQITGAMPYHVNADESYKFSYSYGDTTLYRYADHDPIVVGLKLSSGIDTTESRVSTPLIEQSKVWSRPGIIIVESNSPATITVYNLLGSTVAMRNGIYHTEIGIPQGLYLVRVNRETFKVWVAK